MATKYFVVNLKPFDCKDHPRYRSPNLPLKASKIDTPQLLRSVITNMIPKISHTGFGDHYKEKSEIIFEYPGHLEFQVTILDAEIFWKPY